MHTNSWCKVNGGTTRLVGAKGGRQCYNVGGVVVHMCYAKAPKMMQAETENIEIRMTVECASDIAPGTSATWCGGEQRIVVDITLVGDEATVLQTTVQGLRTLSGRSGTPHIDSRV